LAVLRNLCRSKKSERLEFNDVARCH
jgi:hypothetical protein